MSLTAVLNNAVSGLNAAQGSLGVTSSNIANVNTEGYARKIVKQETVVVGGVGLGVELAEVRRVVDEFITRELRVASAHAERYGAMAQIHSQLQSVLGNPSDNYSLSGQIDNLFDALSSLPVDPSSMPLRTNATAAMSSLGDQFNLLYDTVQKLRAEADRQIGLDIDKVNDAIDRVFDLNSAIRKLEISGQDSSALQDQRAQAINDIAEVMDIRTFDLADGALAISTISGVALLDDTKRHMVYQSQGVVTSQTQFGEIQLHRVNALTGEPEGNGTPLDSRIRSGSLRGWLDMRDDQLPNTALMIGELAQKTMNQLNAVHNDNVSIPPPATLTGRNTGLLGADAHGFTGEATFYALDGNNDIAGQVTIDFGAIGSTVNDVITAVNAGLGGTGTMSLSAGVLSLTAAGAATGVAIQQDTATPSDRAGRGFSHFFGMNDLVGASVSGLYETGFAAGDTHNLTGTINLTLNGPNNDEAANITIDFGLLGGTFAAIETELDTQFSGFADFSFGSDGSLVMTPASGYGDYKLNVVSDSSDRGGTGASFSELFGLGDRFRVDAARDFATRSDIAADQALLALAKIDPTGSPALTESDGSGAIAFQDLTIAGVDFAAAGQLPAVTQSLANYAAQILGTIGADAAQVDALKNDREALEVELQQRVGEVQGVNIDEELSNMVLFQTAYNAAARLIQAAKEMFDILERL